MPNLANLVRVTTSTTGTGTVTLGSAVSGFITPSSAGMTDGYIYSYAIEADYVTVGDDSVPSSREVGWGIYASGAGTLTRNVINSTNSNALLNLAGDGQVIIAVTTQSFLPASPNNLLINGGMQISQERGITGVPASGGATAFIVDCFGYTAVGAGVVTIQQVGDAPSTLENSVKTLTTTLDNSLAATDKYHLWSFVEGYDLAPLGFGAAGASSISLSFFAKAFRAGTYTGAFINGTSNRSYTWEYTINSSNTWEFKTVTATGDTTGTWATDNSVGLYVSWGIGLGSNFTQAAGSWGATGALGTSNQVNAMQSTSDTFQITGAVLVPGSVPVTADHVPGYIRPFNQELLSSMRFYEKSFLYATGVATNAGTAGVHMLQAITAGGTITLTPLRFKVVKRTTPTMTLFNPSAANNVIRDLSAAADCGTSGVDFLNDSGGRLNCLGNASTAVGNTLGVHWSADARPAAP